MAKCIHSNGITYVQARYYITGGWDTDKNIIVAEIYHAEAGSLEENEFRKHNAAVL